MKLSRLGPLALLAPIALVPACAGQPAPEGATLRFQFVDIRVTAIDSMRVSFTPQMAQRFMMRPTQSYAGLTVEVASDGALVMTVPGDYLRANAVQTGGTDLSPRLDIEVWSDDETMNQPPLVRATVVQGTESIAQGAGYLSAWPLELGSLNTINVMCNAATRTECQRM
ncbi:MAG: hypothetical protein OHK0013_01480 [Sandaracinaceae bacterium]